MFGLFSGEMETGTHCTSLDEANDATAETCPHRHRWTLPNFYRGGRGTSWRSSTALRVFSGRRRAHKQGGRHFVCCETASWHIWEAHARSAPTTARSTRTVCSWTSLMVSEFVASLRHLLRHSSIDPSVISRAFKAGHVARLRVQQLYPDICLKEIRGCTHAAGTGLWVDPLLWEPECFNR